MIPEFTQNLDVYPETSWTKSRSYVDAWEHENVRIITCLGCYKPIGAGITLFESQRNAIAAGAHLHKKDNTLYLVCSKPCTPKEYD